MKDDSLLQAINLWWSSGKTTSMLHYDLLDNWLCVVFGEKTVHLYPPGRRLIPGVGSLFGKCVHHCMLSVDEYHELVNTGVLEPQVQVVRAGECLVLPCGWWHYVESSPNTLAVNFWCAEVCSCQLDTNL